MTDSYTTKFNGTGTADRDCGGSESPTIKNGFLGSCQNPKLITSDDTACDPKGGCGAERFPSGTARRQPSCLACSEAPAELLPSLPGNPYRAFRSGCGRQLAPKPPAGSSRRRVGSRGGVAAQRPVPPPLRRRSAPAAGLRSRSCHLCPAAPSLVSFLRPSARRRRRLLLRLVFLSPPLLRR